MNCYICNKGASASCSDCNRWICNNHTKITFQLMCESCFKEREAHSAYIGSPQYELDKRKEKLKKEREDENSREILDRYRAEERKKRQAQNLEGCGIVILIILSIYIIAIYLKNK